MNIAKIVDGEGAGSAFGKINKSIEQANRSRTTHVLTKGMFGRFKTYSPGTDYSVNLCLELEAEYMAVRIGIPNLSTGEVTGVRACVSVGEDFVSGHWHTPLTPQNGDWQDLTFDGEPSVTLPPRVAQEVPSVTYSDLLPLRSLARASGAARPLLGIRLEFPSGSVLTVPFQDIYNWRVDGNHRPMRVARQDVLGVTDKASFTETNSVDTNTVIPVVQYISNRSGQQILIGGDSTAQGLGGQVRDFGAVQRAARGMSTPEAPIEYYNAGLHSQGAEVYKEAVAAYAPQINPTVVFYSPYTINDTPPGGMDGGAYKRMYHGLSRVLEVLDRLPRAPQLVLLEGLPCNPAFRATGAGDQKRIDLNAWLAQAVSGAWVVEGYADALSGDLDSQGQTLIADGMSSDNVHPNDAGYDALAQTVTPVLLRL